MHPSLRNLAFVLVVLACAFSARAADLTSPSFRMRAANEASIAARDELAKQRKAAAEAAPRYPGRPTKKQRRKLEDFLNEP